MKTSDVETYSVFLNNRLDLLYEDLETIDNDDIKQSILREIDEIESELTELYGPWDGKQSKMFDCSCDVKVSMHILYMCRIGALPVMSINFK